ncbi:acyltransferase family protein [Microbacterium sp.]|uniref:acyltransferase family protein n=1 Tax=Microbacterium sp. TaxID=51671 RepID=UPI003A90D335
MTILTAPRAVASASDAQKDGAHARPSGLRLDIQGIRALAVALVVAFHLNPAALPGGYIGVDVFFVVSGFLITAHLMREIERTGTVNLFSFWARRIRRLIPAALLVLTASAIAVVAFLPRAVLQQNMSEIAYATGYILNWNLAANSVDYLNSHNTPSIVQHYWSLSVEEQFYLVWPLLILVGIILLRRILRLSPRAAVIAILVAIFFGSLTFSAFETVRSQPSAYFITTTRAWEFAAGGIVSLLPVTAKIAPARRLLSWGCLLVVIACALRFNSTTTFPGWIATVPVAATAFLLWSGEDGSTWSPQFLTYAGPIQLVGDLSYAIYLWHWPLIVVFLSLEGRHPGWKWSAALVVIVVALSWLTKRFVEDPIRHHRRLAQHQRRTFSLAATAMVVVLTASLLPAHLARIADEQFTRSIEAALANTEGCFGAYAILNSCSNPYAWTPTVNPAATAADTYASTGPSSTNRCVQGNVKRRLEVTCVLSAPANPDKKVVVVGDSHVDTYAAPLQEIARAHSWQLRTTRRAGCSSFAETSSTAGDPECAPWGSRQYDSILKSDTDLVIIAIRSMLYGEQSDRALADQRIKQLIASGKQVVILRTVPGMPARWPVYGTAQKAPECVEANHHNDPCSWSPPKDPDWLVQTARMNGIPALDTWQLLCADGACHTVIGGTIVYSDDNHMATSFALTLRPWLEAQLLHAIA